MRSGFSGPELLVVLAIIGVLTVVSVPRLTLLRNRASVHGAANDVVSALSLARRIALLRGSRSAVFFDTAGARLLVRTDRDTLLQRPLGGLYGTALHASRDSIGFAVTGRGYGAANATIVVERGAAAETVWVSRLGRVRR
jgi:prepilin-type N-terminal cleavage/methylation domain-containing protein